MSAFPAIDSAVGRHVLDLVHGCTFDDFILAPQRSVLERRDPSAIDLASRLSRRLTLKRPIVSANMDTVTRAPMAIVQAEEGGIGIIDRGFRPGEIEPQVREVEIVKRTQHGVITDPSSIGPAASLDEAAALMARSRVGTLVVADGALLGLITSRDLVRRRRMPFATRDDRGRLRVGAAIGATGDYLERAAELVRAGVDVLVIDIAHGHSVVMERAMAQFRKKFPDVELIAGNVATADGARFLADCGADGIKVGIGPGGGCTTRMTTSYGVPQVQALVQCRLAVAGTDVAVIADGGIKRHGAVLEALLFGGDCVMLGSAFVGTEEAPGEVVHKSVVLPDSQKAVKVPFKVLRGMASLEAIRDRLDVEDADKVELEAIGAEGMEISVPARGSARTVVRDMIKHVCSSISYGGASSLGELRARFWADPERFLIRQSDAARRESYER